MNPQTGRHSLSLYTSEQGNIRLFGTESLSDPNWSYKGLSSPSLGLTEAGVVSLPSQQFFKAYRDSTADSDGDGIPDILEILIFGTDPHKIDTSGDGLSDWVKIYCYELDPLLRDTDGDGIDDDEEILTGMSPTVPASTAEQNAASRTIRYFYDDDDRLTGTYFGKGGNSTTATLTPAGNPVKIQNRSAK